MAAEFLSTLSLRRATIEFDSRHSDQNISIHALLAESDTNYQRDDGDPAAFLSTLSLRRATAMGQLAAQLNEISIHALLAESDRKRCQSRPDSRNFYPRSPCGERPLLPLCYNRPSDFYPRSPCGERLVAVCYDYYSIGFLSTLSLRRATETVFALLYEPDISIHALLAESDWLKTGI